VFQRLGFGRSRRGGGLLLEGKFQGGGAVEKRRGDVCWAGEGWVAGIVGKVKGMHMVSTGPTKGVGLRISFE